MRLSTNVTKLLLSPQAVIERALKLLARVDPTGKTKKWQETMFHSHYGSSSAVIANQWFDLCSTNDPRIRLKQCKMSQPGFKRFMMAHFFLWQNPKNAETFGSRFGVCEKMARGYPVWKWVNRLAALSKLVIVWSKDLDAVNTAKRILSLDGIDFRTWEQKHERYNMDRTDCSHKHNHGAAKYEFGLHVYKPQVVWVNGPHPGGKHDLEIFREELKKKVKPWKQIVADRGYRSKLEEEIAIFSLPSTTDSIENNEWKRRVRLRHETFNGRVKKFKIMDDTFSYSRDKHRSCVLAVVGIIQYQMNHGAPIFDV